MYTNEDAELIEKYAVLQSPSRIEELVKIFIHATNVSHPIPFVRLHPVSSGFMHGKHTLTPRQMEIGFWEMFPSQ